MRSATTLIPLSLFACLLALQACADAEPTDGLADGAQKNGAAKVDLQEEIMLLHTCAEWNRWLHAHSRAEVSIRRPASVRLMLWHVPTVRSLCTDLPPDTDVTELLKQHMDAGNYSLRLESLPGGAEQLEELLPLVGERLRGVRNEDTLSVAFLHRESIPPSMGYQTFLFGFDSDEPLSELLLLNSAGGVDVSFHLSEQYLRALERTTTFLTHAEHHE